VGYWRFWLAEYHNTLGVVSAATSVVIGHVAAGNAHDPRRDGRYHAAESRPLVIAEQFGTLEALFPGRDGVS
jgi:alkanesulfonate monooxygenase SsuD/methylene tetrahydromethanopterin reductase-like flavin-dependent oxidoreductase (luciferase family)